MTDDRFDRELRGFFTAREPLSVSPVLRARLQTVPAESPARAGAFAGRLGGAWRAAVGLAAAAAIAVALIALLVRVDGLTIRDPGQAGRPTAVPGAVLPFVTAPAEVFTPAGGARWTRPWPAPSGRAGRSPVRRRSLTAGTWAISAIPTATCGSWSATTTPWPLPSCGTTPRLRGNRPPEIIGCRAGPGSVTIDRLVNVRTGSGPVPEGGGVTCPSPPSVMPS